MLGIQSNFDGRKENGNVKMVTEVNVLTYIDNTKKYEIFPLISNKKIKGKKKTFDIVKRVTVD